MSRFLIVFDRLAGRTLELRRIESSASEATQARLLAEEFHRENAAVEIVVLSSSSEENLRKTHARYFESVSELATRGAVSASE